MLSNARLLIRICALIILTAANVLAQGVHLHDASADKLSQQAQTAFNQVSTSDTNIFATMSANTVALKNETIQHLYELNQNAVRAFANQLPTMTWAELAASLTSYQDEYLKAYQSALQITKQAPTQSADLQQALQQGSQRAAELQTELAAKKKALDTELPSLSDMNKSLSDLKEGLQQVSKVKSLADLKDYQQFAKVWSAISSAKDWLAKAEKATGGPGEQLIILDLAVQLQANAVKLLQLQQQQVATQLKNVQNRNGDLTRAVGAGTIGASGRLTQGDFGKVFAYITPCTLQPAQCPTNGFLRDPNERVLVTIGVLAKQANEEVGKSPDATLALRNLMDVLARSTSLRGYQRFLLLQSGIEEVTDEQLFAIKISAVNADSRAQLINHGLQGIAVYEQGGITPDDIANAFRAAQTIAAAVIAGRL
jgi:hypothetical protein